jgi:hypothetical protein
MNERIEKLAKQSGIDVYGLGMDRVKWQTATEKFAELIIAECATAYHQTRPAGEPIETFFRKHLGVE